MNLNGNTKRTFSPVAIQGNPCGVAGWVAAILAAVIGLLALTITTEAASAAPQGPWQLPASDLSISGQDSVKPQIATARDGTVEA